MAILDSGSTSTLDEETKAREPSSKSLGKRRELVEDWTDENIPSAQLQDDIYVSQYRPESSIVVQDSRFYYQNWELLSAVQAGDEYRVADLVKTCPDPDHRDSFGRTPLSYAAEKGDSGIVKLLIQRAGLKWYSADEGGRSPLSYAVGNGHQGVVEILLAMGSGSTKRHPLDGGNKHNLLQLVQSSWESLSSCVDRGSLLNILTTSGLPCDYDASDVVSLVGGYVTCQWEIPDVLRQMSQSIHGQDEIASVLSKFVILTGSKGIFECSTCETFLDKRWGSIIKDQALSILSRASNLLVSARRPLNRHGRDLTLFHVTRSQIMFRLNNKHRSHQYHSQHNARLVEALIWACSAIRLNPAPTKHQRKLYLSDTVLRAKVTESGPFKLLGFCLEPLRELPLEHSYRNSQCWVQLFQSGIVASHTLVSRSRLGIEMSFDMMVHLAAVENYYPFRGGTILLGFSTALVPISRDRRSGSIQWHFETTDESKKKRLSPRKLHSVQRTWFQTQNISVLKESTCVLGWLERANIHLGSSDLIGSTRMTWSKGLHEQTRTVHRRGFEAGGQVSIGIGPITIAPSIVNTWTFHSNIQRFNPSRQYNQAVRLNIKKVAIVIDSGTRQAWLVPLLGLILHLCHRYFQEFALGNKDDPIPFLKPSPDVLSTVVQVFESCGDTYVIGSEKLRQLFLRISTNLLETAKTRNAPRRKYIFASELMDMICEPTTGSSLKRIPVSAGMGSWTNLIEKIDVVGCCSNIGQLIQPVVKSRRCDCATLPKDQFLLAAHMWCLDVVSTRAGNVVKCIQRGSCAFGENVFWCTETKFWNQCGEETHPSIWEDSFLRNQVVQQISQKKNHRQKTNRRAFTMPNHMTLGGAVVFGHHVATPKVWAQTWTRLARSRSMLTRKHQIHNLIKNKLQQRWSPHT